MKRQRVKFPLDSLFGKQNIQAKEAYCLVRCSLSLKTFFWLVMQFSSCGRNAWRTPKNVRGGGDVWCVQELFLPSLIIDCAIKSPILTILLRRRRNKIIYTRLRNGMTFLLSHKDLTQYFESAYWILKTFYSTRLARGRFNPTVQVLPFLLLIRR